LQPITGQPSGARPTDTVSPTVVHNSRLDTPSPATLQTDAHLDNSQSALRTSVLADLLKPNVGIVDNNPIVPAQPSPVQTPDKPVRLQNGDRPQGGPSGQQTMDPGPGSPTLQPDRRPITGQGAGAPAESSILPPVGAGPNVTSTLRPTSPTDVHTPAGTQISPQDGVNSTTGRIIPGKPVPADAPVTAQPCPTTAAQVEARLQTIAGSTDPFAPLGALGSGGVARPPANTEIKPPQPPIKIDAPIQTTAPMQTIGQIQPVAPIQTTQIIGQQALAGALGTVPPDRQGRVTPGTDAPTPTPGQIQHNTVPAIGIPVGTGGDRPAVGPNLVPSVIGGTGGGTDVPARNNQIGPVIPGGGAGRVDAPGALTVSGQPANFDNIPRTNGLSPANIAGRPGVDAPPTTGVTPAIHPVDLGAHPGGPGPVPSIARNEINTQIPQTPGPRVDQPSGLRPDLQPGLRHDQIPGLRVADNLPNSRVEPNGKPIDIANRLPESLRSIEPGPVRTIETTTAGLKGVDPLTRLDPQAGRSDPIRLTIAPGNDGTRSQDVLGRRPDLILPVVLGAKADAPSPAVTLTLAGKGDNAISGTQKVDDIGRAVAVSITLAGQRSAEAALPAGQKSDGLSVINVSQSNLTQRADGILTTIGQKSDAGISFVVATSAQKQDGTTPIGQRLDPTVAPGTKTDLTTAIPGKTDSPTGVVLVVGQRVDAIAGPKIDGIRVDGTQKVDGTITIGPRIDGTRSDGTVRVAESSGVRVIDTNTTGKPIDVKPTSDSGAGGTPGILAGQKDQPIATNGTTPQPNGAVTGGGKPDVGGRPDATVTPTVLDTNGQPVRVNPNGQPVAIASETPHDLDDGADEPAEEEVEGLDFEEALTKSDVLELPSLRNVVGISEIIKFLEKGGEDKEEDSDKQKTPSTAQKRTRYRVMDRDSLESIAEDKLKDVRFINLLITINRAELNYVDQPDGTSVPVVYPNQVIWLPSDDEVEIYKKNFFKQKNSQSRMKTVSSSQPTPRFHGGGTTNVSGQCNQDPQTPVMSPSAPKQMRGQYKDTIPSGGRHVQPHQKNCFAPDSSPMAAVIENVRFAGHRVCVNLQEVAGDEQISQRRCYQVRLGETLQSVALRDPLMNDVKLWTLLANLNGLSTDLDAAGHPIAKLMRGQFLVLPTQSDINEFKLLNKFSHIVGDKTQIIQQDYSPRTIPENGLSRLAYLMPEQPAPAQTKTTEVEKLSDFCRLMICDLDSDGTEYSITMQANIMSQWVTIAFYRSRAGGTVRTINHKDGTAESFNVDLPSPVAKQMAKEDLRRNWHLYYNRYFLQKQANVVRGQAPNVVIGL
jgi:hypothetical protein